MTFCCRVDKWSGSAFIPLLCKTYIHQSENWIFQLWCWFTKCLNQLMYFKRLYFYIELYMAPTCPLLHFTLWWQTALSVSLRYFYLFTSDELAPLLYLHMINEQLVKRFLTQFDTYSYTWTVHVEDMTDHSKDTAGAAPIYLCCDMCSVFFREAANMLLINYYSSKTITLLYYLLNSRKTFLTLVTLLSLWLHPMCFLTTASDQLSHPHVTSIGFEHV